MQYRDFPKWKPFTLTFGTKKNDGTWQKVNNVLRRELRIKEGRDEEPSVGILDSQSAKTAEKGNLVVDPFDAQTLGKTIFSITF